MYLMPTYRKLGPVLRDKFDQLRSGLTVPGHVYKLMVHSGLGPGVAKFAAWSKSRSLYCLHLASHNMASTDIRSVPQLTALSLLIDSNGNLQRANVARATNAQIEKYLLAWPEDRTLLLPPRQPLSSDYAPPQPTEV